MSAVHGLPAIDYAVLQEFATANRVDYNALCTSVRAALRQSGEAERRDAERYRWLRDNAGAWEVSRDVGEWTRTETGEKFKPRVYFTAYSTGYGGLTIDEAIDAAIAAHDKRGGE